MSQHTDETTEAAWQFSEALENENGLNATMHAYLKAVPQLLGHPALVVHSALQTLFRLVRARHPAHDDRDKPGDALHNLHPRLYRQDENIRDRIATKAAESI
jgi:hypothetical protein